MSIIQTSTVAVHTFKKQKFNFRSPFEGFYDRLKEDNPKDYMDDNFYTVSKRHTYFQKKEDLHNPRGSHQPPLKKLGVRLRARQVLCNRCKNVCTENGETVEPKRSGADAKDRRQQQQQKEPTVSRQKGKGLAKSAKSVCPDQLKFSLVPKIRRLNPLEIEKFSPPRFSISGNNTLKNFKLWLCDYDVTYRAIH